MQLKIKKSIAQVTKKNQNDRYKQASYTYKDKKVEKGRERDRERQRETERQTDRQTERERERRERERERDVDLVSSWQSTYVSVINVTIPLITWKIIYYSVYTNVILYILLSNVGLYFSQTPQWLPRVSLYLNVL